MGSQTGFLRKFDNCDVMAELFAWPLSVAEHERQGAFNHCLISNLVGSFGVDGKVFPSGNSPLLRISEKLFDLLRVNSLWLCLVHYRLARFVFPARHL